MRLPFLNSLCIGLVALFLLPGCASIVSKTVYPIHVRTDPKGANITITDKKGKQVFVGQSPAEVQLKSGAGFFSKAAYEVKISSPGYATKTLPVRFNLNGWYFGNILLGGVIGMLIVDPATGAMWKIVDPIVDETLSRAVASASTTPSLNIIDINSVSAEKRASLTRIK